MDTSNIKSSITNYLKLVESVKKIRQDLSDKKVNLDAALELLKKVELEYYQNN